MTQRETTYHLSMLVSLSGLGLHHDIVEGMLRIGDALEGDFHGSRILVNKDAGARTVRIQKVFSFGARRLRVEEVEMAFNALLALENTALTAIEVESRAVSEHSTNTIITRNWTRPLVAVAA